MKRPAAKLRLALLLAILLACVPGAAQKRAGADEKQKAADLPAALWRDPGDISKLDLFYGAGGKDDAPDPGGHLTFVKEDLSETNPKFDVEDEKGRKWRVKLGPESQAETAATRLLWAAGYFVDEDYYLAEIRVDNLPRLHRGRQFVSAGGMVHGARLELRRKDVKKLGDWDWFENPFKGAKELNSLRVMMCLINNWDLDADNNSIYETGSERRYVVSDAGASFGKTGDSNSRSKNVLKDYVQARFIEKVSGNDVDFVMHSRPFFLTVFNASNYHKRTRMEDVAKDIPIADARWIGHLLAQLSGDQIHDCFRAAGYAPQLADGYAKAVEKRIRELNELSGSKLPASNAANEMSNRSNE